MAMKPQSGSLKVTRDHLMVVAAASDSDSDDADPKSRKDQKKAEKKAEHRGEQVAARNEQREAIKEREAELEAKRKAKEERMAERSGCARSGERVEKEEAEKKKTGGAGQVECDVFRRRDRRGGRRRRWRGRGANSCC